MRRARRRSSPIPLRRKLALPVWGDASLRLGGALVLIFAVVLVHWFDREGLKDSHDGYVSFLDVVYFTMISITTTGFGDIHPISDRSRLFEAVIVTPIRFAVIFIFVGAAYDFFIKRSWEKWRMAQIQKTLRNHIVVLGYGVSGSEAVAEMIARGTDPHRMVVIDCDPERLADAEEIGCNVLHGDATRDDTLIDVRIAEAAAVLGRPRRYIHPDGADCAPPRAEGADHGGRPGAGQRASRPPGGRQRGDQSGALHRTPARRDSPRRSRRRVHCRSRLHRRAGATGRAQDRRCRSWLLAR
jgi:hypothetical protein